MAWEQCLLLLYLMVFILHSFHQLIQQLFSNMISRRTISAVDLAIIYYGPGDGLKYYCDNCDNYCIHEELKCQYLISCHSCLYSIFIFCDVVPHRSVCISMRTWFGSSLVFLWYYLNKSVILSFLIKYSSSFSLYWSTLLDVVLFIPRCQFTHFNLQFIFHSTHFEMLRLFSFVEHRKLSQKYRNKKVTESYKNITYASEEGTLAHTLAQHANIVKDTKIYQYSPIR